MAEQVKEKLSLASENSGVIFMPVSAPLDLPCSAKKEVSPKVGRGRIKSGRPKGKKNKISHQILLTCITCGKTFLTYPCRLYGRNPPIKNCSSKCANKAQVGKHSAENNGHWTGGKTKRICKICHKEFFALKRLKRQTCSYKCMGKYSKEMGVYKGKNNSAWKGGKEALFPKCPVCGKLLTQKNAKRCYKHKLPMSKNHCRGISDGLKGKMPKNTMYPMMYGNIKRGDYLINGRKIFLRSKWEANYALYLDFLVKNKKILKWEYETDIFVFEKIKFGTRSYRPDFKVFNLDGLVEYHEIKGWMNSKSKTKLNRMRIYYPQIKLRIVDGKVYGILIKQLKGILKFY